MGTVRHATILAVLISAGCERDLEPPPEVVPLPPGEIATGLLRIELDLANMEDYLQTVTSLESRKERLSSVQFFRRHVERCAQWAAFIDYDPDAAYAATMGLYLVGVGYDLERIDLEATVRHMSGIARSAANLGIEHVSAAIHAIDRDAATARSEEVITHLLRATLHRDNLLRVLPIAGVMRAGVEAASITSGAYALATAISRAGPLLSRLATFLVEAPKGRVALSVSSGGAAIQVVATSGALVLSEAEILALAQAGVLSAAAVQLHMMTSSAPPKPANPGAFEAWIRRAPKRPVTATGPAKEYQIKQCGPAEIRVSAESGEGVWADGARASDGHLLEAKHVETPGQSPYVDGSKVPPKIRAFVEEKLLKELRAYATALRDPTSPAVGLEIITNDPGAVSFFERAMKALNIPGRVVVKP